MKFAHDFKAALATQDFPEEWVRRAIPYSQLKKCLKKVQRELEGLGLDAATLRTLLDKDNTSPIAMQYKLDADSTSDLVHPKLTVMLLVEEGVLVDASLSSASKLFLKKLATDLRPHTEASVTENNEPDGGNANHDEPHTNGNGSLELTHANGGRREVIEVPLVFDSEFFDLLQSDVHNIEDLQKQEQTNLTNDVLSLKDDVAQASKPSRFSKNDLVRWREIFELYLDAGVFFANLEQDHGARTSAKALKQLQWFQEQVDKRSLAKAFKLAESRQAFSRFLEINASLLKNLQFQELNSLAVSKILKKFDKRTALGVSKTFPNTLHAGKLLSGSIAKDVCSTMSQELMTLLPQINDYLCPVCFSLAYRPVRLDCQHVFCIRCIIKIQRRGEHHCPLCRADVVMKASADNLDRALEKYLRKYFPNEVKEKQRANEIERGIEDYGPSYKHQECIIM